MVSFCFWEVLPLRVSSKGFCCCFVLFYLVGVIILWRRVRRDSGELRRTGKEEASISLTCSAGPEHLHPSLGGRDTVRAGTARAPCLVGFAFEKDRSYSSHLTRRMCSWATSSGERVQCSMHARLWEVAWAGSGKASWASALTLQLRPEGLVGGHWGQTRTGFRLTWEVMGPN